MRSNMPPPYAANRTRCGPYDPPMPVIKQQRAQVERLYSLTDQLKVQLEVLEDAGNPLRVEVRPVPGSGNVEEIAFLVVMSASRDGREDLKAVMEQIKAITAQRKKVRTALKERPSRGLDLESVCQLVVSATKADLDRQLDQLRDDLDALSELSETESLRLQMMMDRRSKFMSTLSNILKKLSDTASAIVQNLK